MNITRDADRFGLKAKLICICIIIGVLIVERAIADSVKRMCKKSDEVCTCASKQLKADVGDEDYVLYEVIGMAYITNESNGMSMGDAWDAAVKAESKKRESNFTKTLTRTNAVGKAHRKAIKNCSG